MCHSNKVEASEEPTGKDRKVTVHHATLRLADTGTAGPSTSTRLSRVVGPGDHSTACWLPGEGPGGLAAARAASPWASAPRLQPNPIQAWPWSGTMVSPMGLGTGEAEAHGQLCVLNRLVLTQ